MSAESDFWAMKGEALTKGINPARMGQLAKLCNDFNKAEMLLQSVLKAKNPSTYLGAVIQGLKDDLKPIITRDEPEIALQARLHGWPVRKTTLKDGRPAWFVAGVLYDRGGIDVGG